MDFVGMVGACVAVAGLLLTLVKLMTGSLKSELDAVKSELSARDLEQEKQITKIQSDIETANKAIGGTRAELHTDYAKRVELESVERGLRDDVNKVFEVVNAVSRDLNQMIGEFRAWNQVRGNRGPAGE